MSGTLCGGYDIPDWDWKKPQYEKIYDWRIARLKKLRENPEILLRLKEYYAGHPAEFLSSWASTVDPRLAERGMRTVVPFILWPRQKEYVEWVVERWKNREDGVVEKTRDCGASWLSIGLAVWMFLFVPGAVIGFGSRKEMYVDELANPASLFWKARELINLLPQEFQPTNWDSRKHAPYMKITNPDNDAFIVGEAGDGIGRGNRTSIFFVDEAAFIERAESVEAALSQTSNCRIYVSTPNGAGNPFYRRAHDGRTPKFIFDWRQDERKSESWYEQQCAKLDPIVVAQEIDRNYTASVANAFIVGDVVSAAARKGPMDIMPSGPLQMGVDVARFGDDRSVISIRRGRVLLRQRVAKGLDVVNVAGMVKQEIAAQQGDVHQIAVDTIGIGAGVADILRRDFGEIVVDVNSSLRLSDGQHYNLRARMWSDMREWLKSGASIPNDPDLISDLTALQYGYKAGELLLESKDDAKRRGVASPDRADALALTFAFPVKPVEAQLEVEHPAWQLLDELTGY